MARCGCGALGGPASRANHLIAVDNRDASWYLPRIHTTLYYRARGLGTSKPAYPS